MRSVEVSTMVVEPVEDEPGSAVPVEVLMVVVEPGVRGLSAAVTVLDTVVAIVAPTLAELVRLTIKLRSVDCPAVQAPDGGLVGPMVKSFVVGLAVGSTVGLDVGYPDTT
jgi:hypothetical protein